MSNLKKYTFNYNSYEASASFEVDHDKFTAEEANATLNFFSWNYDKEADPVDEVLKKYAMKAIKLATFNSHNTYGVISDFKDEEGYAPVDGSFGIKLLDVEGYEFDEDGISLEGSLK